MANERIRNSLVQRLRESYRHPQGFDKDAYIMDLFFYQFSENELYRQYCHWLGKEAASVTHPGDIPLLPIAAFKNYEIKAGEWTPETMFKSSGTTSARRSMLPVKNVQFYLDHTVFLWEQYFGSLEEYCFLALLPGYIDRGNSSLVYMVDYFIRQTRHNGSDFILGKEDVLEKIYRDNHREKKKTVLFGVSFALMALIEKSNYSLENLQVIETGGMKGLREDLTKEELILFLRKGFGTPHVYSEYGMTELFSQAYTSGGTAFQKNDYLNVYIRQLQDPLSQEIDGKQGILGCIDLANIDTCSFILTEDSGFTSPNKTFTLTGRTENADMRGCNLLLADTGFIRKP